MSKIIGQFTEPCQTSEYIIMSFSASSLPIQDRWRNNSLSANFLADYWEFFFLAQATARYPFAFGLKDTFSYVMNELLENAVKFHHEESGIPIRLGVYQIKGSLQVYVTNSISAKAISPFQAYLQTLLSEDLDELYLRQIEGNARQDGDTESHLGLITLLNDYQIPLGWKFERAEQKPNSTLITTMAQLAISSET